MADQISRIYSESNQSMQVKAEIMKQTKKKEVAKERTGAKKKEAITENKSKEQEDKERLLVEKRIKQVIEEVNQKTKFTKKSLEYSVDEKTNRIAIVVRDQETKEVIKEIPSEETLDMLAKIQEVIGLVFDQKF